MSERNVFGAKGLAGDLNDAVNSELEYIRSLSRSKVLSQLGTNLGVIEAVLIIIQAGEEGVSLSSVLERLESSFVTESVIIKRLRVLRELGIIDERVGIKRSSVSLFSSKCLLDEFGQLLLGKLERKQ